MNNRGARTNFRQANNNNNNNNNKFLWETVEQRITIWEKATQSNSADDIFQQYDELIEDMYESLSRNDIAKHHIPLQRLGDITLRLAQLLPRPLIRYVGPLCKWIDKCTPMVAVHWSPHHLQMLLQQLLHYLRNCLNKLEYIQCVSSLLRSLGIIMFERSSSLPRCVLEEYFLTIAPIISVGVEQECIKVLWNTIVDSSNEYMCAQLQPLLNTNKSKNEYIIPTLYFNYYMYSKNRMSSQHQQQQFHVKGIQNINNNNNNNNNNNDQNVEIFPEEFVLPDGNSNHESYKYSNYFDVHRLLLLRANVNENNKNNASNYEIPLYARDARRFVWNARKLAIVCVAHVMLKSWYSDHQCIPFIVQNHPSIIESICECLQQVYYEYYHHPSLIIENTHDLSKNITPIVVSLKKIVHEMSSWKFNSEDNGISLIKDSCWIETVRILQQLMVIGTRSESSNEKNELTDVSSHLKVTNEENAQNDDNNNNNNNNNNNKNNNNNNNNNNRHRNRNRVTFDWAGKEYHQVTKHYGIGYTSENVLLSSADWENMDQSTSDQTFFMPFDVFSKLRHQIQQCLHALIRASPKVFDELWWKLLPNDDRSAISRKPFGGPNILTVTIYDPHPRVRHAALGFLHCLMDKCPLSRLVAYIHQTSSGQKEPVDTKAHGGPTHSRSAFTPMSDRALSILQAIHHGLMYALQSQESQETCKAEIVKCLKAAVQMTNYSRLKEGYLSQITRVCLAQMSEAKGSYKMGLFVLLAAVFDQKYYSEELDAFFHVTNDNKNKISENDEKQKTNKEQSGRLINIMSAVLQELKTPSIHNQGHNKNTNFIDNDLETTDKSKTDGEGSGDVRAVISSMARNYRAHLCQWWSKGLKDAVATGLGSAQLQTVVETLKMIHQWMVIVPISPGVTTEDAVFGMLRLPDSVQIMEQWLPRLFNRYKSKKEHSGIRGKLLNILLCFKKWHWDLFSSECQQLLVQCTYDRIVSEKVPHVRAIACRVIGSLGTFIDGKDFYATSSELLIKCLRNLLNEKESSIVGMKASLALANICDPNNASASTAATSVHSVSSSNALWNAMNSLPPTLLTNTRNKIDDLISSNVEPMFTDKDSAKYFKRKGYRRVDESTILRVAKEFHKEWGDYERLPVRSSIEFLLTKQRMDEVLQICCEILSAKKRFIEHQNQHEKIRNGNAPVNDSATNVDLNNAKRVMKPDIICQILRIIGYIGHNMHMGKNNNNNNNNRENIERTTSENENENENELKWCQICQVMSDELWVSAGRPKEQWSACCTVGLILSNPYLCNIKSKTALQKTAKLFYDLHKTIDESDNYKTRLCAVSALMSVPTRVHYSFLFEQLFKCSFQQLCNVERLTESFYVQHKYKALLKQKLSLFMFHLLLLCRPQDVSRDKIRYTLINHWQVATKNLEMMYAEAEKHVHWQNDKNNNANKQQKLEIQHVKIVFNKLVHLMGNCKSFIELKISEQIQQKGDITQLNLELEKTTRIIEQIKQMKCFEND